MCVCESCGSSSAPGPVILIPTESPCAGEAALSLAGCVCSVPREGYRQLHWLCLETYWKALNPWGQRECLGGVVWYPNQFYMNVG